MVPSHPELPHCGNLGRLLAAYPDAVATGDVRDLHLFYPEAEGRLEPRLPGDELDLGGRRFRFLPAVLHDLANTTWGYDDASRTLFVCDGFICAHHPAAATAEEPVHAEGECRLLLSEAAGGALAPESFRMSAEGLYWTRRADPDPVFDDLDRLLAANPARILAPCHGNLIDTGAAEAARLARLAHRAVYASASS